MPPVATYNEFRNGFLSNDSGIVPSNLFDAKLLVHKVSEKFGEKNNNFDTNIDSDGNSPRVSGI